MFNTSNNSNQPPYWMNANRQTDLSGITPYTQYTPAYNPVPNMPNITPVQRQQAYAQPIIKGGVDVPMPTVTPYQFQENTPAFTGSTSVPIQTPIPTPVPRTKTLNQVIQPAVTTPVKDIPTEAGWGDKMADTMINLAQGKTYSQAKRLMNDFVDCSSLVTRAFQQMGLPIPNSTVTANLATQLMKNKYSQVGTASFNDYASKGLQRGDILLFPSGPNHSGHVMVYNGDGNVVEANGWNGSHVGINPWGAYNRKGRQYQVWRR